MAQRLNKPKVPAGGEIFKRIGDFWDLYKIAEETFKLVAKEPVYGHANYTLLIKDGMIISTLDSGRLKTSRPELFKAVEAALDTPEHLGTENDPYGDIAIRAGKPLTQEQDWKRRLFAMRLCWVDSETNPYKALVPPFEIERAINAHYRGIFKMDPPQSVIDEVKAYVFRGEIGDPAALEANLVPIRRAYYDGDYAPNPIEQYLQHLDILMGVS